MSDQARTGAPVAAATSPARSMSTMMRRAALTRSFQLRPGRAWRPAPPRPSPGRARSWARRRARCCTGQLSSLGPRDLLGQDRARQDVAQSGHVRQQVELPEDHADTSALRRQADRRAGLSGSPTDPAVASVARARSGGNEEAVRPSVSAGQDRLSDLYPRRDSNPRYRHESPNEGLTDDVDPQ